MPKLNDTGVYQLKNGYWGFRYAIVVNNKRVERKRNLDEQGNPYKTKTSAVKARRTMIEQERNSQVVKSKTVRVTVQQVYNEYCEFGRAGKAYATIVKQDSLWNNHVKSKFGEIQFCKIIIDFSDRNIIYITFTELRFNMVIP